MLQTDYALTAFLHLTVYLAGLKGSMCFSSAYSLHVTNFGPIGLCHMEKLWFLHVQQESCLYAFFKYVKKLEKKMTFLSCDGWSFGLWLCHIWRGWGRLIYAGCQLSCHAKKIIYEGYFSVLYMQKTISAQYNWILYKATSPYIFEPFVVKLHIHKSIINSWHGLQNM